MNCPRCTRPLEQHVADEITVAACRLCGGVWLDNDGSRKILRDTARAVEHLGEEVSLQRGRLVDVKSGGITCPVCATPLAHKKLQGDIDIDFCLAHGTWFDAFELNGVLNVQREFRETFGGEMAAKEVHVSHRSDHVSGRTFDGNDEHGRALGALGDTASDAIAWRIRAEAEDGFWQALSRLVFGD